MFSRSSTSASTDIDYPECDGQPMAENTLQFRWIMTIQGNLDAIFWDDPNVFVAGDLLWYPVEGNNKLRAAPDTMIVFGRPKGDRGSYLQWREAGVPPQVVFEVLSPGNRSRELAEKFEFYRRYGVEEYYIIDPDQFTVQGWLRRQEHLEPIPIMDGWISPRLRIRFQVRPNAVTLFRPSGAPFLNYTQLNQRYDEARREVDEARREVDEARHQADQARQQAERLAARLRDLGHDLPPLDPEASGES